MKALASADLNSHLELAQQFLNIGKPFLLEGIGSLVKIRSGQYEFTAGVVMSEKVKEYSIKEINATSSTEDSFTDYNNVFNPPKTKSGLKKPVMFLLIIAGLGLTIWGGYTISKRSKNKVQVAGVQKENIEILPATDTVLNQRDSVVELPPKTITPSGEFKFVVEVADKLRGLDRYGTLKSWGLNVKMETRDSINFKLFFQLHALSSDTTRMLDSLSALYTPSWSKAFVEN
jgi:hypothetical protein